MSLSNASGAIVRSTFWTLDVEVTVPSRRAHSEPATWRRHVVQADSCTSSAIAAGNAASQISRPTTILWSDECDDCSDNDGVGASCSVIQSCREVPKEDDSLLDFVCTAQASKTDDDGASTADGSTCASEEGPHVLVEPWTLSRRDLESKKVRLARSAAGPFATWIEAKKSSADRGGCSFAKAKGRGQVLMKWSSPKYGRLTQIVIGARLLDVNHTFADDNIVYRSPELDFLEESNGNNLTIELHFEFLH